MSFAEKAAVFWVIALILLGACAIPPLIRGEWMAGITLVLWVVFFSSTALWLHRRKRIRLAVSVGASIVTFGVVAAVTLLG